MSLPKVQQNSENSNTSLENASEKASQTILQLQQKLSTLRSFEINQYSSQHSDLDPCIDKYAKHLSSLLLFKKELEHRRSCIAEELRSIEEETKEFIAFNESKVAKLNRLIKEAKDDLKAMLDEKERHEKVMEAAKGEVESKFEEFKRAEMEKFSDAEAAYLYKKLSLLKKVKAVDSDIEAVSKETSSLQNHLNDLKVTNRELRSKYYKLEMPNIIRGRNS